MMCKAEWCKPILDKNGNPIKLEWPKTPPELLKEIQKPLRHKWIPIIKKQL